MMPFADATPFAGATPFAEPALSVKAAVRAEPLGTAREAR